MKVSLSGARRQEGLSWLSYIFSAVIGPLWVPRNLRWDVAYERFWHRGPGGARRGREWCQRDLRGDGWRGKLG